MKQVQIPQDLLASRVLQASDRLGHLFQTFSQFSTSPLPWGPSLGIIFPNGRGWQRPSTCCHASSHVGRCVLCSLPVRMKVSRWNGISSLVLLIFWVLMALGTTLMDKHQLCKVLYKHRRKKSVAAVKSSQSAHVTGGNRWCRLTR